MAAKATPKGRYWYVEINAGGKRKFQKQKDEATALWVADQWNLRHAKPDPTGLTGSKAFDDVAERWWAAKSGGWAQTSRLTRKTGMDGLIKQIGKRDIRELNEDAIDLIAQGLCPPHTTYKRATVAFRMDMLATIVGWAVGKVIKEHPCKGKTIRSIGRRVAKANCAPLEKRDAWTHDEAKAVLDWCAEFDTKRTRHQSWLYDAAYFSLRTGCRRGELAALQWGDLDVVRGNVTFRQSKSLKEFTSTKNAERTRPLSDDILAHVRKMHERRVDDTFVFRNAMGDPIYAPSLSSRWPKLLREHKPTRRRLEWHCWRHTWASWALDEGWSPERAAWYIGDTADVFRKHYAHILRDQHLDLNFFTHAAPVPARPVRPRTAARRGRLTRVK